jgi:hypothetical protein
LSGWPSSDRHGPSAGTAALRRRQHNSRLCGPKPAGHHTAAVAATQDCGGGGSGEARGLARGDEGRGEGRPSVLSPGLGVGEPFESVVSGVVHRDRRAPGNLQGENGPANVIDGDRPGVPAARFTPATRAPRRRSRPHLACASRPVASMPSRPSQAGPWWARCRRAYRHPSGVRLATTIVAPCGRSRLTGSPSQVVNSSGPPKLAISPSSPARPVAGPLGWPRVNIGVCTRQDSEGWQRPAVCSGGGRRLR